MSLSEELAEHEVAEFDPELMVAQLLEDPSVTQHQTRSSSEDGETLVGYFRCRFDAGQQRAVLHVPLSPAFETIPTVEAMLVDEVAGRIRVTDCQRFGLRLEVVLGQAATERTAVLVEVIATG